MVKNDGLPYTVFTPFKNKWLAKFKEEGFHLELKLNSENFNRSNHEFPTMEDLGFKVSSIKVPPFSLDRVHNYQETRNFPFLDSTSKIGPHLRFGTVSIREIVSKVKDLNDTYLSELVWREFFMQILWHFPKVVHENFRPKYNFIKWRNNEEEFEKWCKGETGYPIVDAGMRELNSTGFMHNRVRMIVASFLTKHLLVHWIEGERWFWDCLLDADIASNACSWQWVAGSGADASPYFRIFNPIAQGQKFDSEGAYVRQWCPELSKLPKKYIHEPWEAPQMTLASADLELGTDYPFPIVDHKTARLGALDAYAVIKQTS